MQALIGRQRILAMDFKVIRKLNSEILVVIIATPRRMMYPGILSSTRTMVSFQYHVSRRSDTLEKNSGLSWPRIYRIV
jgi:hypothetical protein